MNFKTVQIFAFLLVHISLFGQIGYVPVEDEIYDFLIRMNTLGIISNYNSFELPKTRGQVKEHLVQVFENMNDLDNIDRNKLKDFLVEFEYDLLSTGFFSGELFPEIDPEYLLSEKEKFLYKYFDDGGNTVFINFVGKIDYLHKTNISDNFNNNSVLYRFGGDIRGSLFNNFGYGIISTNGSFFGGKKIAQNYSSLRYNYKFNQENEDNSGDNYFDETSAYLVFENKFGRIKIGNDRNLLGIGPKKVILGNSAPKMDYISLKMFYKSLEFSFYHGKLLGNQTSIYDSLQGEINIVDDKYLGYHRLGLNINRHFNFGIGEMVVYANRNLDFSYLNPVNFYKGAEHGNQDRDNTFLFFDFQNNSINGLKLYSTLLIDDIDFAKLGKGWYGNKSIISIGAYSSLFYNYFPIDIEMQYIKIDPYVYTHRINNNNFTNSGYNLSSGLKPNSSNTNISIHYRPIHRISMILGFNYILHGENIIDESGDLIKNYGGDINFGHRPDDSDEIYFLDGKKEIFREIEFMTIIEPIKNWHISFSLNYSNNSLVKSQKVEELFSAFSISAKL